MPLISQSIPNLIGGISQQPPEFRRSNQCTDILNAYMDPVSGVKKRPGSQHIKDLGVINNGFYGSIDRDSTEKYFFNIDQSGVRVWDIDGVERTVNTPDGVSYLSSDSYKYLTVADNTFIVNQSVTVGMLSDVTDMSDYSGFIFIRAVDYDLKYTVDIDGVGASPAVYTTPSTGTIDTETVAQNLASQLNVSPNITAVSTGPVIGFTVNGGFTLKSYTSLGDNYITASDGVIENFGDLPVIGYNGTIIKVSQDPTTDVDDYFVRFDVPGTSSGNGVWVETVAPGIEFSLDPSTMPHVLVSEADGTFTFKQFDWTDRVVGDVNSNPLPSFVGSTLNNIFFERNRLGFVSDVNCIMSESNSVGNFFRTTVSTIIDSDPIDLSVSGSQVDILRNSIGVKDGLLLFSDDSQFLLNVGDADILSPETASITTISSYQSNTRVDPERVGDSIYFLTRRDNQSGVREFLYESNRDFTQSASITNHVPRLLPSVLDYVTGSSTENIVFFYSFASSTVFVYQYLYNGSEKVISSWAKWDFNQSVVDFAHVFDDFLYLILSRNGQKILERIQVSNTFIDTELPGETCLDSFSSSTNYTRSFDGTNTNFVTDRVLSSDSVLLSTVESIQDDIFVGQVLNPVFDNSGSSTIIQFPGDVTGIDFLIGETYSFIYEMSPQFVRIAEGDTEIEGRFQVRNISFSLFHTGNCRFRIVYDTGEVVSSVVYIDDILDWSSIINMQSLSTSSSNSTGTIYELSRAFPSISLDERLHIISSYVYRVPVMCENTGYQLFIENDGFQPLNVSKAQIEGMYHKRSRFN